MFCANFLKGLHLPEFHVPEWRQVLMMRVAGSGSRTVRERFPKPYEVLGKCAVL